MSHRRAVNMIVLIFISYATPLLHAQQPSPTPPTPLETDAATSAAMVEVRQLLKASTAYHAKFIEYQDSTINTSRSLAKQTGSQKPELKAILRPLEVEAWVRPNHILQKSLNRKVEAFETDSTHTIAVNADEHVLLIQNAPMGPRESAAFKSLHLRRNEKETDSDYAAREKNIAEFIATKARPTYITSKVSPAGVGRYASLTHPFQGCNLKRVRLLSRDAEQLTFEAGLVSSRRRVLPRIGPVDRIRITVSAHTGLLMKRAEIREGNREQTVLEVKQVEVIDPASLPDAYFKLAIPEGAKVVHTPAVPKDGMVKYL